MASHDSQSLRRFINEVGPVDQVGIEERVAKYATRSIKKNAKVFGLKLATTMVDLTTLEGKDTPGKVASLCQKALHPHDDSDIPTHRRRLRLSCHGQARRQVCEGHACEDRLRRHRIPLRASPVEDTPRGSSRRRGRWSRRDRHGHQPRGLPRRENSPSCRMRSPPCCEACGEATLKVIFETSELETYDNIRAASFLAMQVLRPGDFIKTSTGKDQSERHARQQPGDARSHPRSLLRHRQSRSP